MSNNVTPVPPPLSGLRSSPQPQTTAAPTIPTQPQVVYLVHQRDEMDGTTMKNPGPTRVFYDRNRAIAAAQQAWRTTGGSLLIEAANELSWEDGDNANGTIYLLCDDAAGDEGQAMKKVWVECCQMEDAGMGMYREAAVEALLKGATEGKAKLVDVKK